MTREKRIPGTVGTDISEDRKGDVSRTTPRQPDLYVEGEAEKKADGEDDRERLDDAVEEEPWTEK